MSRSRLLSTSELASALKCTGPAVRGWVARGLKPDGQDGQGRPLFRPAAVRAWLAQNQSVSGNGGKRPGAGRLKGSKTTPVRKVSGKAKAPDAEALRKILAGDAGAEQILAMVASGQLSRAQADTLTAGLKALRARLAYDAQRGKYLEAADVEAAWTDVCSRVAVRLEALDRTVTLELSALLKLDEAGRRAVAQVVARQVGLARGELVADIAGEDEAA